MRDSQPEPQADAQLLSHPGAPALGILTLFEEELQTGDSLLAAAPGSQCPAARSPASLTERPCGGLTSWEAARTISPVMGGRPVWTFQPSWHPGQ